MFDEAALLQRLMGDRELARAIIEAFVEDMPRQLAALEPHVAEGDTKAAELRAHSIRGAAANVGSVALQRAALAMEEAAAAGDSRAMPGQFRELKQQFDLAREAMRSATNNAKEPRNGRLA